MTRRAEFFDRLTVLLLGLGLAAVGLAAVSWRTRSDGATETLSMAPSLDAAARPWWTWACGVAGVVLILAGMRWLAAHRRAAKPPPVRLEAAGAPGNAILTADVAGVVDAATQALRDEPAVLKANAKATRERGTPTVTLDVTVAARQGLSSGVRAADDVAGALREMLGDAVAVRTRLRVDAKRTHAAVR